MPMSIPLIGQDTFAQEKFGNRDIGTNWSPALGQAETFFKTSNYTHFWNRGIPPSSAGAAPGMMYATDDTGPLVGIGFGTNFCHEKNRFMQHAFPEALLLARAAVDYFVDFGDDPRRADLSSFFRYFAEDSLGTVVEAFLCVFQFAPDQNTDEANVNRLASTDFDGITISYRSNEDGQQGWPEEFVDYCSYGQHAAALGNGFKGNSGIPVKVTADPRWAVMILCQKAYQVGNLPKWNPPAGIGNDLRCSRFTSGKDYAYFFLDGDQGMDSLGSRVLHEILHFQYLFHRGRSDISKPQIQYRIVDYDATTDRTNNPGGSPPNGYGPWNAQELRRVSRDTPTMSDHAPAFNADSYVYFALEAYWGRICNMKFQDSPQEAQTFIEIEEDDAIS